MGPREVKHLAPEENQTLAVQSIAQYPHNAKFNYYDYELILGWGVTALILRQGDIGPAEPMHTSQYSTVQHMLILPIL
jgi:hypothetical protein